MRRSAALVLLSVLAACSRGEQASGTAAKETAAQGDDRVSCALGGAKDFAPDCTREVTKGPDGETWIVHHPDGGFRRFVLIDNGARIATADGADEVKAERVGADLEVRVAGERYRFPAAPETAATSTHAPAS
ncbi:hypothetical protein KRR38_04545 [Novosphingobium sp. G106]|uniref:hypothetical protein n=1 Tax=Novosphingobium sp. G106 TaxID=2849500 RepID=UPI001C2D956C|nr:hypothetical protein [Novosphingobium sp. G106]MBV1686960.1 hypothetical protein [Novosphingobium sp. G106]